MARRLRPAPGLPVLPGTPEPVRGTDEMVEAAHRIGLPLIMKATAGGGGGGGGAGGGGGGRGMAVVRRPTALLPTFRTTRATARTVFGDDSIYLERYWDRARHVE